MSRFTDKLNEVLDYMKSTSGISRHRYAASIGMPNSTFGSYTSDRVPDGEALAQIVSGFREDHAIQVIEAYLYDHTPVEWRKRLPGRSSSAVSLNDHPYLSSRFRKDIELLIEESLGNDELIDYVRGLVRLLGLKDKEESDECQSHTPENFRIQTIPVGNVGSERSTGRLMPSHDQSLRAAEEAPIVRSKKSGPRPKSTRPGIAKTVQNPESR